MAARSSGVLGGTCILGVAEARDRPTAEEGTEPNVIDVLNIFPDDLKDVCLAAH